MVPRSSLENSTEKIQIVARLQYIFLVISIPALGAIKLSVLFFYRRIFVIEKSNLRNMHNIMYTVIIAIVAIWIAGFCFTFMFACKGDFDAWWHSALSLMTKCIDTLILLYAYAISDFISDVIIILIPIPSVSQSM